MSAVYDGNDLTGLVRVPDRDTLSQRDDGAWVAVAFFRCKWSLVFQLMPRRYVTAHPDFNSLICDAASATKEKPGVAIIQVTYIGLPNAGVTDMGGGSGGENSSTVEIAHSSSQEPLPTHPDFRTFGGTSADPADGADFDDEGFFNGFLDLADGEPHPLKGVDSYLSPTVTVRETSITKTRPTEIEGVGETDANVPGITGNGARDYLKTHHGWRRAGGVWQVEKEWLKAKRGSEWSDILYPD